MFAAIHWAPDACSAPIFQNYRADEITVRALTRTQVELHKQHTAYNALFADARNNQEAWARMKAEMVGRRKRICSVALLWPARPPYSSALTSHHHLHTLSTGGESEAAACPEC